MSQNTGIAFEDMVFNRIDRLVRSNQFMIGEPNVRVRRTAKYYSYDRNSDIEFEIAVEKYLGNPDTDQSLRPAIIVVVECKDYKNAVPVDDVEEFHAKLQQIGADNTKGIIITRTGAFQKSALKYAFSKGIALARILPDSQIQYIMHRSFNWNGSNLFGLEKNRISVLQALTEKNYRSEEDENFFALTGETSLKELLENLIK